MNFNLSIQQQLGTKSMFEIVYVGSQVRHAMRYSEWNFPNYVLANGQKFHPARGTTAADCLPAPASASLVNACNSLSITRRNPNFDRTRTKSTDTNSHYNGLQVKLVRQASAGMQFQVSYTYSKVMDQQGGFVGGDNGQRDPSSTMDPEDTGRDWGRAAFDSTHVVSTRFTYPAPFKFNNRAASLVLSGWELQEITTAMSGQPMTAQLIFDNSRTGSSGQADRPNLVPGCSQNPILHNPDQWYDPRAFSKPAVGFYGNLGRNTMVGPTIVNFDLSLQKRFNITENTSIQFRTEIFNLFNHPNWSLPFLNPILPDNTYNPSAGYIVEVINSNNQGRQIQFGLKIVF